MSELAPSPPSPPAKTSEPLWGFNPLELGGLFSFLTAFVLLASGIMLAALVPYYLPSLVAGVLAMAAACFGVMLFIAAWFAGREARASSQDLAEQIVSRLLQEFEAKPKRAPQKRAASKKV